MTCYIAFLRGINLGKRRVKMDDLRSLFEKMGFDEVTTYIASGNVIFASRMADPAKVETLIERELAAALGYPVDTFVRTRSEIAAISTLAPFSPGEMTSPTNTINVGLFKQPLPPTVARQMEAIQTDVDEIRVIGREYFWLCRIKMSESKVWTLPAARALKLPTTTMRNLKTLRNLAEQFPFEQKVGALSRPRRVPKASLGRLKANKPKP